MATIDDIFSVNLVPTLQHITAARICIDLYLQDHLLLFLKKHYHLIIDQHSWTEQKSLVRKSISTLCLPESLKSVISHYVDNIGDELLNWMKSNDWFKSRPDYGVRPGTFPAAVYDYLKHCLVWASRGTIRYEKSARNILRSTYVSDEERFHLACAYCFSDVLSHRFVSVLEKYRSLDMFVEQPLLCYWACRLFPEKMLTFKIRLGLSNRDNIHKYMLLNANVPKNCIAKKHLFDKLDLIDKENVINGLLEDLDFKMKIYFLSQISVGTREDFVLSRPYLLTKKNVNILWQDYLSYYFTACESICSSRTYARLLREVFPYTYNNTHTFYYSYEKDFYHEWKKSFLYDIWCSLSEDYSREVMVHSLNDLNTLQPNVEIRDTDLQVIRTYATRSVALQLFNVALHFNNNRLINKLMRVAVEETVQLEVSNRLPNDRSVFSINSETFKLLMYYPRRRVTDRATLNVDKRLHFIQELLTMRYSRVINPLKTERLQNDIIDLFVEYCRCLHTIWIDEMLTFFFEKMSERCAYKSSLFSSMFGKLLTKAVNESFYYFDEQWAPAPPPAPRAIAPPPAPRAVPMIMHLPVPRVNVQLARGRRNFENLPLLVPPLVQRNIVPVRRARGNGAPAENVDGANPVVPLRRNFADDLPIARRNPVVEAPVENNNRPAPRIVNPARRNNEARANPENPRHALIRDAPFENDDPEVDEINIPLPMAIYRGFDGQWHQRRVGRVNVPGVIVHRPARVNQRVINMPMNFFQAPVLRIPRLIDVPNVVVNPLHAVGVNERQVTRTPLIYNSDDSDIIFSGLNAFLNWHFITEQQIEDFKTETIYNERIPIIEELLSQNKTAKLKILLRWFLSNNEEKINAFKNTSRRNELTSLL